MSTEKSSKLISHYQELVSKKPYAQVIAEVLIHNEISIETLVTTNVANAPYEYFLYCILFHTKKTKKDKVAKCATLKKDYNVKDLVFDLYFLSR